MYHAYLHVEANLKQSAKEIINKLKSDGHKIYIISYRGKFQYENAEDATRMWLDNKGILYDELIVEHWDKGEVCQNKDIDLLIDDEPIHLKQAKDRKIKTILFNSDYNQYDDEFLRVNDWNHIYDIIRCGDVNE